MLSHKQVLTPRQKALQINLNKDIYGTFSEIGAGQETVRYFFRAGAASKTIAKAISAYDKEVSDSIYGKEPDNRYVSQARLHKMLDHEIELIEERIDRSNCSGRKFFSYANTVTTINFNKTFKGHGWVGIRFQLHELEPYNEIILHVRFHENDTKLQQETLGILGVNLIYGSFFYSDNPKKIISSLYDELSTDQIEIDMINFSGPDYAAVDNRLMSLQLVKNGMADAAVFEPNGKNVLPADELYNKNIFALRGSFRPVTHVNIDMCNQGLKMFMNEKKVNKENTKVLFEITLSNLLASGEINEQDFLDRADVLGKLGYTVLISNFSEYYRLVDYFSRFTTERIGISMGVNNLLDIFKEGYYNHLSGGIMEAFGKLFKQHMRIYLYPYVDQETGQFLNSENLKVNESLKDLYKYFKKNKRIVDIKDYNESYLRIYGKQILTQIASGKNGWEINMPNEVADMIKEKGMFGYSVDYAIN
ncbi:nicotinate-nucleotide adenylyltransferase [Apibacter sp. wkB309]|uniref:nicotinate-nucleotide adenylyltransferase n=1 Tax=Apibacter sp. wkB309 TaxID=1679467 RepID=UPI000CF84F4D|nr:nicotinate-nucleotide adenylyltransferase [Apibacter sp. wkB309]PQL92333.1 nicotinate-nucleotide adenylyltransferase [Apibacter sp. wkB309]